MWRYLDGTGVLLFAACRFETPEGKVVLPYCCGADAWRWKAPQAPRPLYGLDRLAVRPDAPVLVVEGEKAADAAALLFPDYVVVAWQGGSKAVGKADWSVLSGRAVILWPDNDKSGIGAMADVSEALREVGAARVAVVRVPGGWPEGWDLADPPPEGADADTLRGMLAGAEAARNLARMLGAEEEGRRHG